MKLYRIHFIGLKGASRGVVWYATHKSAWNARLAFLRVLGIGFDDERHAVVEHVTIEPTRAAMLAVLNRYAASGGGP